MFMDWKSQVVKMSILLKKSQYTFFFFFFLAMPEASGSFCTRDQTLPTAETMPDP